MKNIVLIINYKKFDKNKIIMLKCIQMKETSYNKKRDALDIVVLGVNLCLKFHLFYITPFQVEVGFFFLLVFFYQVNKY